MTSSLPPVAQELWWVTCADDLLDLHAGDVNLLGKLAHCLIGVLIGEGVNVDFHSRCYYWGFSTKNREVNLCCQAISWKYIEMKTRTLRKGLSRINMTCKSRAPCGGGCWRRDLLYCCSFSVYSDSEPFRCFL